MALILLDAKKHMKCGWKRFKQLSFSAKDTVAPVFMNELTHLIAHYPLAFIDIKDVGFQMVAVIGIHPGENLFLNDKDQWIVPYVPACYRFHPFTLRMIKIGDETRRVLCFDDQSGLFRETPDPSKGEERFFDDDGKPMPLVIQLMKFLESLMVAGTIGRRAADTLAALNLFIPWDFPFENPNPEVPMVKGLFRINEKTLNDLKGEQLETIHKINALPIIYAHLLSMNRIGVLSAISKMRLSPNKNNSLNELPPTLEALFGEGNDDTINFDWLK